LRIGSPFTLGNNGTETAGTIIVGQFGKVGKITPTAAGTLTSVPVVNYTTNVAGAIGTLNLTNARLHATDVNYNQTLSTTVQKFSDRAIVTENTTASGTQSRTDVVLVDLGSTADELKKSIFDTRSGATKRLHGANFFNYDIRGVNSTITSVRAWLVTADTSDRILVAGHTTNHNSHNMTAISLGNGTAQGLVSLNGTETLYNLFENSRGLATDTNRLGLLFNFTRTLDAGNDAATDFGIAADFFAFGYFNDGLVKSDRVNNMIVRIEAEESGDNTGIFEGTLEYVMLNQLNILDTTTYTGLTTIANDPSFIVHQDLDDEEAPRVNYNDLGADGVITQVADQEDAPSHSGVVSFDKPTYKKADTVVVTLEDQDLNVDVDLIDIYTVVNQTSTVGGVLSQDPAQDAIGKADLPVLSNGDALGRLLDITFDDARWIDTNNACTTSLTSSAIDTSLQATGFTLIETNAASGIFTGDFQVPGKVCNISSGVQTSPVNAQGLDMEVNYVDFRDASGQIVEVGDGAGIRANTGSVSLDRTVYPIPFGSFDDFATPTDNTAPSGRSIFPIHLTGIGTNGIDATETLGDGILTLHVQVNDPDFDTSASGEDKIAENTTASGAFTNRGPVKITVSRGQSSIVLGYAGGDKVKDGVMDVAGNNADFSTIRQLGPITETSPSSGIFEFDLDVLYTDGPASTTCPTTAAAKFDSLTAPGTKGAVGTRFDAGAPTSGNYCLLQGDIVTVEYTDPADASGDVNTVTDSATFDLRNGALQSDKSVYIIGSDMILTLIEPDLDLDNDLAETYDLDLI
ncbi:MAG: hypothetical protein HZC29_04045, partial [Thaumarchaeota archaeon]|nr:hypothetical protein [Nitrososphaerota archaeon]